MTKEQFAELKERIIAVQNENDKRFTVYMWAFSMIMTLVMGSVIYTLNKNTQLVKEAAQETAKKEFIKEFKIFKRKYHETLREIKAEKDKIEALKFDFEQLIAMEKEARIVSTDIQVKESTKEDDKL